MWTEHFDFQLTKSVDIHDEELRNLSLKKTWTKKEVLKLPHRQYLPGYDDQNGRWLNLQSAVELRGGEINYWDVPIQWF